MRLYKFSIIFLLIVFNTPMFSQNKLPMGFRDLTLGLTLSETKQELIKDSDFGYHGDRDVSLIPGSDQILIETINKDKNSYISQCWFQFYNDYLYTIIININTKRMDYFSLFSTLTKKYGNPDSLDPQKATWSDEDVTVILEKPLSIKYIDNHIKDELSNYSTINKAAEEISRQMFLDEF